MTPDGDMVRSNGGLSGRMDAPQNATEIMIDDLLKGIDMKDAEKRFFANIGAYVVGKMQDFFDISITREIFLDYAPKFAAGMNYLSLDGQFFEKAIDAAMELGYARLEQHRIILTKSYGVEAFAAVMRKERRYS